jgi:exonuclease III
MSDTLRTITNIDEIEIARTIECDNVGDLMNETRLHKSDFTIITQNIRSIYCNFDDFVITLSSFTYKPDIIILTECRLNCNKPLPQLATYDSYSTSFQLNQNDGVAIYVKSKLKHKVMEIKLNHASCLQLEVLNNTVLGIYRSPSNVNPESFIESLQNHLESLKSGGNMIIAGDININLRPRPSEPSHEYKNRNNYLNMLSSFGLLAGHTKPTRGNNCLDHFILKINKSKYSPTIAIIKTTTSDHYSIFLSLAKTKTQTQNNINKTKTTLNFEDALRYLKQKNLSDLIFCNDPHILTNRLIDMLNESVKINSITTSIPSKNRIMKPWISPGILRCIRNRNKLQKQLNNDPDNTILKITYTRYRNYCNNLIKKLKRKYERELLANSMHSNKLLWKNIKNLTYTTKSNKLNTELLTIKTTPSESAHFINKYFVDIGKELALKITPDPQDSLHAYLDTLPVQSSSLVLLSVSQDEVFNTLYSLKSNSAPGWDNVSTKFLKYTAQEIVPVITHLINLSINLGTFPISLKKSLITPVYKSGDRDDVSNYRPISVLPAVSKIFEKIINARLLGFFTKFNLLSESQFGFRQGKSTEDTITALTSEVVKHVDNKNKCLAVFLDLKKAFDTVSIPILIQKLEKMGVRGIPLSLFKSYLSDRKQRVKLGEYISDDEYVSYGVPQGSVLGPTLFLAYINDLCDMAVANAKVFSYADDTAIVFVGKTWIEAKTNAEQGLAQVSKWLRLNLLTLNTDKTKYMCFSITNSTQPNFDVDLKIHSCHGTNPNTCSCPVIEKVSQIKYLGVTLDEHLNWYAHLDHVIGRVRKLLWIFRALRHIVPGRAITTPLKQRNILTEIYTSLVQSVLVYCISIWGGAAKTRFIDLERAQRALLKVMYFKKIRFPTDLLYQLSDVLTVRKLYILHVSLKKHKTLTYDANYNSKRTIINVASINNTKTKFARSQYNVKSGHIYNKLNKCLNIYPKPYYDCKIIITKWLKAKNYQEIENLQM